MGYKLLAWSLSLKKYKLTLVGAISVGFLFAIVQMSQVREELFNQNLYDSTPAKTYEQMNAEINRVTLNCQRGRLARSADGSCNNLLNPSMGKSGIRFGRNISHDQSFASPYGLMDPNPREISLRLLTREQFQPAKIINVAAAAWLQFMTHDWFNHGDNQNDENCKDCVLVRIPLAADDPLYNLLNHELVIYKSKNDETFGRNGEETVFHRGERNVKVKKAYQNVVSHWWDGSQIYGSDVATQHRVRGLSPFIAHRPGEIILINGRLPIGSEGVEDTGFNQNWWLGLGMLHTLFAREHNLIAQELRKAYSEVSLTSVLQSQYSHLEPSARYDEYIFDKARLIVTAEIAKIHTVEWTPAIIANPGMEIGMRVNWAGIQNALSGSNRAEPYDKRLIGRNLQGVGDPAIYGPGIHNDHVEDLSGFVKGASPFVRWAMGVLKKYDPTGNGYIGADLVASSQGLVGTRSMFYKVPFTLTEEFTSVYRMHPLIPDTLTMMKYDRASQSAKADGELTLEQMREKNVHKVMDRYSFSDLWYTFGTQYPGALTLHNYPRSLQNIMHPHRSFPFVKALDLATVDIVRDRERGVPRYNQFRRLLKLPPLERFEDFYLAAGENRKLTTDEQANVDELKRLYGVNGLEKVDLLVGTLAESVRPDGFGFGETAFQIFLLMASRRLMTDRFFSEDFTAEAYTELGIKWVNNATFKGVLERHVPEIAPLLAGVEQGNAFKPWPRSN